LENLHASFDYLRITIASPQRIKSWAQRKLPSGEIVGEVLSLKQLTFELTNLNYMDFCEKILDLQKLEM
jgi:DNA-directed RNA polymerase subunit beta'